MTKVKKRSCCGLKQAHGLCNVFRLFQLFYYVSLVTLRHASRARPLPGEARTLMMTVLIALQHYDDIVILIVAVIVIN